MKLHRAVSHLLTAVTMAIVAAGIAFIVLGRNAPVDLDDYWSFRGSSVIPAVVVGVVGWVICQHRPRNAIGWLFSAAGVLLALDLATREYSIYGTLVRSDLPGVLMAAWSGQWLWVFGLGAFGVYLPLLFPDGRLPSRRWRIVAWTAPVAIVAAAVGGATSAKPIDLVNAPNPFAVEGPLGAIANASPFPLIGWSFVSVAGLVVRFRRSSGVERQQLKWLTFAVLFVPVGSIAGGSAAELATGWLARAIQALSVLGLGGMAVAAAIAILRHNLYDIDRIINRTVVYATVTALLGAVYVGATVALAPLTGESNLAVAAATLACAAAFRPLRRRVQSGVDRRFNRTRYDAARTLDDFSARLRDQVELDNLLSELRHAVAHTMAPDRVVLWLPGRDGGSRARPVTNP